MYNECVTFLMRYRKSCYNAEL